MRLFADDVVNFPKERVYLTQRDAMPNLVAYLPNVAWIKVLEREDLDGGARILNLWKGADSDVPRVLRPFVKPEVMQWKDHAQWSDADHHVDWRLEKPFGKSWPSLTSPMHVICGSSSSPWGAAPMETPQSHI